MKLIARYVKEYRMKMIVGCTLKFTAAMMDLVLPMILSFLIDEIVPLQDVNLIIRYAIIMLVCAGIAIATNIKANQMASKVSRDSTQKMRNDLFEKTMSLSAAQIDAIGIPSLEIRLTSDTYNIHRTTSMMQRIGVRAPFLLVGGILMTLFMEPLLALIMVLMLPLIAVLVYVISVKGVPMYKVLQERYDGLIRVVRENISGVRVIKALSKESYENKRFKAFNEQCVKQELKVGKVMAISNPMMNLFLNSGLVFVIVGGAYAVSIGASEPGVIVAFLSYFTIILNAMLSMTRIFIMLSKASASAKRIEEVLSLEEDLQVVEKEVVSEEEHIVFDNVSFSYQKKEHNVKHINFQLKHGETLGIIGATGSGKSTILSLLMRFYDVDEGEVRIDGVPIQSIDRKYLHTLFGVVLQNDFVISESIMENISFGRELQQEQVEGAAMRAQAIDFIESLDARFEHHVSSKGSNLSGGQKQRLLIARALANHPKILILDDSSSALDYKTDANLRQVLKTHYCDVTSIIVAQRVSSIKHADKILMLQEGEVIGYGSHEYLLESCNAYRFIAQSQMGGSMYE